MLDFSSLEYKLKDIEQEARAAGISTMSDSGQISKSEDRRRLETEPSAAQLQAELKRAMSAEKEKGNLAAQKVVELSRRLSERQKLEKKFDRSKYLGRISDLETKLQAVERQYISELGVLHSASQERQGLADEVSKMQKQRESLMNQRKDLELRQHRLQTPSDVQRWLGDAERLGKEFTSQRTEEEQESSKIRQFSSRYQALQAVPRETIERVARKIALLKRTLEKAKTGE